jgi:hypothetical protein
MAMAMDHLIIGYLRFDHRIGSSPDWIIDRII